MAQKEIKTKILGVSKKDPKSGLNRQEIIKKHVKPGTDLIARLEPDNPVDPNAVAIWLVQPGRFFGKTEYHLGYLSEEWAAKLAPVLRQGVNLKIDVLGVTGGTKDKESYGVNIVIRH